MTVKQEVIPDSPPKTSVKHDNFVEALAAAQMEFVPVKKNRTAIVKTKTGGQYQYKYADLGDVLSMCLPIFARNGIAVSQPLKLVTTPQGSELRLVTELYWGDATTPAMKSDGLAISEDLDPQDFGGVHSYWRRYDLCSLAGIAPEEDVDGRTSTGETRSDRQARGNEQPNGPAMKEFHGRVMEFRKGQADSGEFVSFNLHNEEARFITFLTATFDSVKEGAMLSGTAETKRDSKNVIWYKVTKLESDAAPLTPQGVVAPKSERTAKQILDSLFPTSKELKYRRLIEKSLEGNPEPLTVAILEAFEKRVKAESPNGELGLLAALDIAKQEGAENLAEQQFDGLGESHDNPSDH